MKKIAYFLGAILLAVALVSPGSASRKRVDVDGDTIKFMDANLDTVVYQDGNGTTVPNVYRICVDGLEFLIVDDKGDLICVQVLDRRGDPKTCRK